MKTHTDELNPRHGKVVRASSIVSAEKKAFYKAIVSRTPEVMVKVSRNNIKVGGKTVVKSPRDKASLKGLLQYIGKDMTEVKDERGVAFHGDALNSAMENWRGIDRKSSSRRIALHMVLSMPPALKSNEYEVNRAAERFCETEFSGYQYFIAHHKDTNKPHSHVIVRTTSICGKLPRLSPARKDCNRYRDTFVSCLEKEGIQSNATKRIERLSTRQDVSPVKYAITKDRYGKDSQEMHDLLHHKPGVRQDMEAAKYRMAAQALSHGPADDQELGRQLNDYVDSVLGPEYGNTIAPQPEIGNEQGPELSR